MFCLVSIFSFRTIKNKRAWYFYPLDSAADVVKIDFDKANARAGEQFASELRKRINEAAPTTEQMISLLYAYGVLTPAEAAQLDARMEDQATNKPQISLDEKKLENNHISSTIH